jgi:hypothetical protein
MLLRARDAEKTKQSQTSKKSADANGLREIIPDVGDTLVAIEAQARRP